MTRLGRVVMVTVVAATSVIGTGSAAFARTPETWTEAEPRSVLETLGLFVGLPVGLFLLITLLTVASTKRREPRYRPDREWDAESVWIGSDRPATEVASEGTGDGGGASARW